MDKFKEQFESSHHENLSMTSIILISIFAAIYVIVLVTLWVISIKKKSKTPLIVVSALTGLLGLAIGFYIISRWDYHRLALEEYECNKDKYDAELKAFDEKQKAEEDK